VASVPLTIRADDDPGTALLYVTAAVDGVEHEFLLDTGASRSRLLRSAQTERWAVDAPDPESRGVFGSTATGPQARVPEIALGPIVAHDVVVDVADDGPAILGLDVLAGHRIGVRLSARALQIDERAAIDRWRPLRRSSRGHPLLEVMWDAATAVAVWDTGSSTTVIDADFARAFPGVFPVTGTTSGVDANGREGSAGTARVSPCRIGERGFAVSTAATVPLAGLAREGDPAFTMIIGYPLITQADWVFDLRARMWGYLDRV